MSELERIRDMGPILWFFDEVTRLWSDYCSLLALPFVQGPCACKEKARHVAGSDLIVLAMLAISFVAFAYQPSQADRVSLFWAALATYGIFTLSVALSRLAVLAMTRGEREVSDLSPARHRRLIILAGLNVIELINWYSVLYFYVAQRNPTLFNVPVTGRSEAYCISMSTMFTVGYGNFAPARGFALGLATTQAALGLMITVVLVGMLIAILSSSSAEATNGRSGKTEKVQRCPCQDEEYKRRVSPEGAPIVVLVVWVLLAMFVLSLSDL